MKKFFIYLNSTAIVTQPTPGSYIFEGDKIEVRDEYHSMHELYEHRMALNIALFDQLKKTIGIWNVIKSKFHYDGTMFPGYFIVMATTDVGQISYHYKLKHWDKFDLQELELAPKWDGHTSVDVLRRLMSL